MLAKHSDPIVDHVLKTWAPRMIVQGIDYNDLMTTGERIRSWDDWCREWCVTAAGHEQLRARQRPTATEKAPAKPTSWRQWPITSAVTIRRRTSTNTFPRRKSAWNATRKPLRI